MILSCFLDQKSYSDNSVIYLSKHLSLLFLKIKSSSPKPALFDSNVPPLSKMLLILQTILGNQTLISLAILILDDYNNYTQDYLVLQDQLNEILRCVKIVNTLPIKYLKYHVYAIQKTNGCSYQTLSLIMSVLILLLYQHSLVIQHLLLLKSLPQEEGLEVN